jgi:hypothetical protein
MLQRVLKRAFADEHVSREAQARALKRKKSHRVNREKLLGTTTVFRQAAKPFIRV